MSEIIITGHRNPDMDSVCAAFAYAELKNSIDSTNTYTAVRCGHLTNAIKEQFIELGITPPMYKKNIFPTVGDVMLLPEFNLDINEPVYNLFQLYNNQTHRSVIPVFEDGSFYGLLSVDDITSWFLEQNRKAKPVYEFDIDNLSKVIEGSLIHRGTDKFVTVELLAGAMDFVSYKERVGINPNCFLVIGNHPRQIKYAIDKQIKGLVITGVTDLDMDFSNYNGSVYCTMNDTAEVLRLLRMCTSIKALVSSKTKIVGVDDLFSDARDALTNSSDRGLAVFDKDEFKGFVTRRCFLHPPKHKVIMVDHNEVQQSIAGIETAELCEIIDHHRLAAEKTTAPIFIDSEPLGSTCTIVYHLFQRYRVTPSKDVARVLLSGILADTVLLKSPTTTFDDYAACEDLCTFAEVEDMIEFGQRMYSRSNSLVDISPRDLIEADFKRYKEQNVGFGIGQCEVTTLEDIPTCQESILSTLEEVRKAYDLDWAMLMISDVIKEESVLLCTSFKLESKLAYEKLEDNKYFMPKVLSRKKQLLPEIIRVVVES